MARLKYHSNNSVSELSGEQRNHATEDTRRGPARYISFRSGFARIDTIEALDKGNIATWYDLALNQPEHVQNMFKGNYRERCSRTVRVSTLFREDLIPIRSEANQDVFKWTIAAAAYVGAASEVPGDAIRIRNTAWGIIHMGEVKIQSRDDVRDA